MIVVIYIIVPVFAVVAAGSVAVARYMPMPVRLPGLGSRGSTDKVDIALRQLFASHQGRAEELADALIRELPDDEWLSVIKAEADFRSRRSAERPDGSGVVRYRPVNLEVVLPSTG